MAITYGKKDNVFKQYGKPSLLLDFARRKKLLDTVSKKNPITFTRASSVATYVDSDGLIKKAPVNLALYSEQIDNGYWLKTRTEVSANQIIAPDGKQTADKLYETTANGSHNINKTIFSSSGTFTFSAYLKKGERRYVSLVLPVGLNDFAAAMFDLEDGVVTDSLSRGSQVLDNFKMESVGNGWFRCSITGTCTSAPGVTITLSNSSTLPTSYYGANLYTGTYGSGVYVWGIQAEEADPATMAPTEYIKTTSTISGAPRFDHEPTSGNLTTNLLLYSEMLDTVWASAGTGTTVNSNATTAPDGTLTADEVVALAGSASSRRQTLSTTPVSDIYTFSFWVKASTSTTMRFGIYNGSFIASSATVLSGSGSITGSSIFTITGLDSGWTKVSVTTSAAIPAISTQVYFYPGASPASAGESVYLWGIQFEKSSSAGTYVRTLGETRSISDARAESKGLLIEEARTNAITNSEDLSGAFLTNVGTGVAPSRTLNYGVAPDGTQTAERFVFDRGGGTTASDYSMARLASFSYTIGDFYYYTLYVKAVSGSQNVLMYAAGGSPGVVITTATVTDTEWKRIEVKGNVSTSGVGTLDLWFGTRGTYGGDDELDVLLWGLQAEEGVSFPTSYIPTNGSTVQRTADIATIEGNDFKRTNLLEYSEQFNQSPWVTARLRTVVADATTAPNGTTTADYIEQQAGQTNAGGIYVAKSLTASDTISVYAKAAEKSFLRIQIVGGCYAYFDLSNCTVGTTGGSGFVSASIENVGNGWCRLILTQSLVSNPLLVVFYLADADNNTTVTDSGGVYLWGAQFERSAYPTDYIPTTTTSASAYSWANEEAGTMLCEYNKFAPNERQNRNAWTMDYDGSNYIGVFADYAYNDNIFVTVKRSAGGEAYYNGTSKPSASTDIKISYSYTTLTSSVSTNAGSVGAINNSALPDMDRLTIGARYINTTPLNGHIKKMTYWNSALSGSALQLMTGDE
jgi:hypothetical protein